MLSRSSIFLKLIGSFYEQIGATEFNNSIDDVYSSIIYSRYYEILLKSVITGKNSSAFESVRLGYVKPLEIDVSNKTIVIRDISSNIVDSADFISISQISPDKIFKVSGSGGVIHTDSSVILELANSVQSGNIPILYGTIREPEMAIASWVSAHKQITNELIENLSSVVLEKLSKVMIYTDDSKSKIELISNIFFGAMFSNDFETVLKVDDDYVFTDKNQYKIDSNSRGRVIVSEGDSLKPMQLISKVVWLSDNPEEIVDIQKVSAYMASHGLSISNFQYLYNISKAVAKRKIVLHVPADIISRISTETLSVISSVIRNFNVYTEPTSEMIYSDTIDGSSNDGVLIREIINAYASVSGQWTLDISESFNATADATESIVVFDTENGGVHVDEHYGLDGGLQSFTSDMEISDNALSMIVDEIYPGINDTTSKEGLLVDTNFGYASEDSVLFRGDSDSLLFSNVDSDGEYANILSSGTVSFYEKIPIQEAAVSTVSARNIASIILSDSVSKFTNIYSSFSADEGLKIETEIRDAETFGARDSLSLWFTDGYNVEVIDLENNDILLHSNMFASEKIASFSLYGNEDFIDIPFTVDSIDAITDAIFIEDAGNIESDITIDD